MNQRAVEEAPAKYSVASNANAGSLIIQHMDLWTSAISRKNSIGRGSNQKHELFGIKKLRELILELAVRGKLVPQDPDDEPASELLKRISQLKMQLVKEGKIKKPKKLPANFDESPTFHIPAGWAWTRIEELAEVAPRNEVDDEVEVAFVPMPLIGNGYKGDHAQEVRLWSEIKKGYTHFANGDVAIAKITPCFENSKAVVFSELKGGVGAGTTELHVARPLSTEIDRFFILLYLKSPQFLLVGEAKMTGSAGQKRVPTGFFASNPLPLPPQSEQHRIVAKVDELMALCDQLENQTEQNLDAHATLADTLLDALTRAQSAAELAEHWQRLEANWGTLFPTTLAGERAIDKLKQTILQLAVMGKLVPQDPNDEPASELLKRIAAKKEQLIKDKKIKKQKPLSPIGDDEKPFDLPEGWKWCRLQDIAVFENGDRSSKYPNSNDLVDSGVHLFGAPDIAKRKLKISSDLRFISDQKFSELSNGKLVDRDFVILLRGTVGKTAQFLASGGYNTGFINAQMLIVRLIQSELDRYLDIYFQSDTFGNVIAREKSGAVIQQIPASKISEIIIPLPPLAEQHRIVAKVGDVMIILGQLKQRFKTAQQTQQKFTNAVVATALAD